MTESVQVTNEDVKTSTKSNSKALKLSNDNVEHGKSSEKAERPLTKVVVRHLPPTMTLESFVEQVSPLPPVDYMYFVKADSSLGLLSFSRAYLNFVNIQDLIIFTEKFDNYVFIDAKGNEYPAIVEFSPFQRIPKQRTNRKKDPRAGTIENDPYYLEFVEALKAEEAQRKSASKTNKQHFFETTSTNTAAQKVTSTPLLEYLKARKLDKIRVKEDKINEKKKRELERKKAREERTAGRQGEGDAHPVKPQATPLPIPSPDLAEIQTRNLRQLLGLETELLKTTAQKDKDNVREDFAKAPSDSSRYPTRAKPSIAMDGHFVIGTKNLCEMIESGELRVERPSLPPAATRQMTTLAELEKRIHRTLSEFPCLAPLQHRKHRYSCQRRQRRHRPTNVAWRTETESLPVSPSPQGPAGPPASSSQGRGKFKIHSEESNRRTVPHAQQSLTPSYVRAARSLERLEVQNPWHYYHSKPYHVPLHPTSASGATVNCGHVMVTRRPPFWPHRVYYRDVNDIPDDRPRWFAVRRKWTPFVYLRQADCRPRRCGWITRN